MFVATVTWEYRTSGRQSTMRFACVSDVDEYRDLLRDPATDAVWLFEPIAGLDAGSPDAFELVRFSVNGKSRSPRRSTRKGSQLYTVALPQEAVSADDAETAVSYTYRTLVQRNGHMLHIDFNRPTHGLTINLSYTGVGIRRVSPLTYLSAAQQPMIASLPVTDPSPSTSITFDGWVLPRGGVAFVWVLEDELADPTTRILH